MEPHTEQVLFGQIRQLSAEQAFYLNQKKKFIYIDIFLKESQINNEIYQNNTNIHLLTNKYNNFLIFHILINMNDWRRNKSLFYICYKRFQHMKSNFLYYILSKSINKFG